MKTVYARRIGVDVAADKIDVNDSDCKIVKTLNAQKQIRT